MKALAFVVIVGLIAFGVPGITNADGIPIKDGRYSGGPSIVIDLTASQKELVDTQYKPFFFVPLSDAQREDIGKQTSVQPPPTKIMVVKVKDTVGECTCGAANLAILISSDRVEMPVKYVYTDAEAEKRRIQ